MNILRFLWALFVLWTLAAYFYLHLPPLLVGADLFLISLLTIPNTPKLFTALFRRTPGPMQAKAAGLIACLAVAVWVYAGLLRPWLINLTP